LNPDNSLKKYRERLGKSQKEICKELNMSQATFSKVENGLAHGDAFIKYIKYLVEHDFDMNYYFRNWKE